VAGERAGVDAADADDVLRGRLGRRAVLAATVAAAVTIVGLVLFGLAIGVGK